MATITARNAGDEVPVRPADREPAAPWVIGGVGAELAARFRASAPFVRVLLLLSMWAWSWRAIGAYAAAALLLPHSGVRRPGWRNVIGAGRLGLLFAIIYLFPAVEAGSGGLFSEGPAVWVPFGGAVLAGFIALLASGRRHGRLTEAAARTLVVSWLPAIALALAVAAGMFLVPTVRWELVLDAGIAVLALTLVGVGLRGRVHTSPAAIALLALTALFLGFSGARVQGGVGAVWDAPRSLATVRPVYRRAIGSEVVDLSRLRGGPGRVVAFVASVGIGSVTIALPANSTGMIDVRIGAGRLDAFNQLRSGAGVSGFVLHRNLAVAPVPYGPPGSARDRLDVRLVAEVGRGCVTITQGDESASVSC